MTLLRPAPAVGSLFRTLFLVAISAASFIAIDSVLANTERKETALAAARFDREGGELVQKGKFAEAAAAYRSATANARDNRQYPLKLAEALLKGGQLNDAGATLSELLTSEPMAGAPNLAMARVLAKEGRTDEAAFYYHRAIYGQWKDNAENRQLQARFELADFLAEHNSKAQLLAELLPLQEQAPDIDAVQKKLAGLYIVAGSPARAAAIFHELARIHPRDADAQNGIGDAELARSNYAASAAGYATALRLRPDDQHSVEGVALTTALLALDPTRRGLGDAERFARSLRVLQQTMETTAHCAASVPAELLTAAQAALQDKSRGIPPAEKVEENLELARKLWRFVKVNCAASITNADKPLQFLLERAEQ